MKKLKLKIKKIKIRTNFTKYKINSIIKLLRFLKNVKYLKINYLNNSKLKLGNFFLEF